MAAVVAILAVGSACSGLVDPIAPIGPADPDARMEPDLIVPDPAVVAPGGVVALSFPNETVRGIAFVLEVRAGESWAHRYNLFSDGPGAGWRRSWQPAGAEAIAVEDIGVGGVGPDRVPIPETAPPGEYRICTGNAGENFCAPIEIVAP
jgi:hypothetical protein